MQSLSMQTITVKFKDGTTQDVDVEGIDTVTFHVDRPETPTFVDFSNEAKVVEGSVAVTETFVQPVAKEELTEPVEGIKTEITEPAKEEVKDECEHCTDCGCYNIECECHNVVSDVEVNTAVEDDKTEEVVEDTPVAESPSIAEEPAKETVLEHIVSTVTQAEVKSEEVTEPAKEVAEEEITEPVEKKEEPSTEFTLV